MSFARVVLAAAFTLALAAPAFAFQCPSDVKAIDEAMASASLSDADKAKVTELRDQGQQLHQAGQHQQAVDTLAQAKQILGI